MAPSSYTQQPLHSPSLSQPQSLFSSSYPYPNTPPEHLSFQAMNTNNVGSQQLQQQQANRPTTGHKRVPSNGQQQPMSGLSLLQNGNGGVLSNGNGNANAPTTPGQQFEGGRSPPNSKSKVFFPTQKNLPHQRHLFHQSFGYLTMSTDLSHVPCKFFRQGTCQAGKACPFLHSMDGGNEQLPCKYFQKVETPFGISVCS